MKTTIFEIIGLMLLAITAAGQSDVSQNRIAGINNSQLAGNGQYFWQVVLVSKSADSIIAESNKIPVKENRRKITNQLIPLLTDSLQGIAIHYLLCAIWYRQHAQGGSSVDNSKVTYHGLTFSEKSGKYSANQKDLLAIQTEWLKYIRH